VWKTADGQGHRRGVRDGFDRNGNVVCESCFAKKLEIDQLREENRKLKEKLERALKREVLPLGAHSPPSHRLFKKKSSEEKSRHGGGARVGHKGAGRIRIERGVADEVQRFPAPEYCPDCREKLRFHDLRTRSVYDVSEANVKLSVCEVERKQCPRCRTLTQQKLPLFPRALYSNALLSRVATMHYLHGIPMGRVCEILGPEINLSGILAAMHRVADAWEPTIGKLIAEFRESPVKHADETGWRIDGQPGWSWIFCTSTLSIFKCQNTRSGRVANEILGDKHLPGVLIVDRYSGYNKAPCQLQYCYAHLLREVRKLEEEFPNCKEVTEFVTVLADLLSAAMALPSQSLTEAQRLEQAQAIAAQIKSVTSAPSKHVGIQSIQRIFTTSQDRLFQWAMDADVPCHNNRAERELRQTVIARKVSFGSQSQRGAKTRSILMSVLLTAKKRLKDSWVESWFADALNQLALGHRDPFALLPPVPT